MYDPTNDLKEAFDSIHAEQSLKEHTSAYVHRELAKRRKYLRKKTAQLVASAACFLLVFFAGYGSHMYFDTVSVISIDINPSIELGINPFDRVISVQAYNADGSTLTETMQLHFLRSVEAVEKIVSSESIRMLLEQDELLAITLVGENEEKQETLRTRLTQFLPEQENTQYYCSDPQTLEQAHVCGLSYGKYRAYQEAVQQGDVLTVEQVQTMTMQEIRSHRNEHCDSAVTQPTEQIPLPSTEPTVSQDHHSQGKHNGNHH